MTRPVWSTGLAALARRVAWFWTIAAVVAISVPARAGQPCVSGWSAGDGPGPRYGHSVAFDTMRNVLVLFGGRSGNNTAPMNGTWEYDGARWQRIAIDGPPGRDVAAMAYHAGLHKVFLVGGMLASGAETNEVWSYDGQTWALEAAPPFLARSGHSMVYDAAREQLVMFGGANDAATWLFSNGAWRRNTATTPGIRTGGAMAYDPVRQRVCLFGADNAGAAAGADRMNEWDGNAWTQVPLAGPSARGGAAMEFDPQNGEVVVFGGRVSLSANTTLRDAWGWNGTTWTQRTNNGGPVARWRATMSRYPGVGLLLFGGATTIESTATPLSDQWVYTPGAWSSAAFAPTARQGSTIGYDAARGYLVMFGGFDNSSSAGLADTWTRAGDRWTQRFPSHSPTARQTGAMAFDPDSQRLFLYGPPVGSTANETHVWDGNFWTNFGVGGPAGNTSVALVYDQNVHQMLLVRGGVPIHAWSAASASWISTGVTPPASQGFGAFYDEVRSELVFVNSGGTYVRATEGWTRIADGVPSLVRDAKSVVYDSVRNVAVALNGACTASCATWEWNGSVWVQRNIAGPANVDGYTMAFDAGRGVVVLFGGWTSAGRTVLNNDVWEYDGVQWRQSSLQMPSPRADHSIAYDRQRQEFVLFGGRALNASPVTALGDTWTLSGGEWRLRSMSGPTARVDAALVYDETRRVTVLMGGRTGSGGSPLRDVWEWDGQTWTQRWNGTTQGPAGFPQAIATYNPLMRREVWLQGNLLWIWDGAQFSLSITSGEVPPSFDNAMTYDTDRNRLVLFNGPSATLFELDGTVWSRVGLGVFPRPSSYPAGFTLDYDAVRGVSVLYGRPNNQNPSLPVQAWEWNGVTWAQRSDPLVPSTRHNQASCIDGATGRLFVHGGANTFTGPVAFFSDSWRLGVENISLGAPPNDATQTLGETAMFGVQAASVDTIGYQWRYRGGPIAESEHYVGANSATLSVVNVSVDDEGEYDCVITGPCGSIVAPAARLRIIGVCEGDITRNGRVDLTDLAALLVNFGRESLPPGFAPDIDGDGSVTVADLARLLRNFGITCD